MSVYGRCKISIWTKKTMLDLSVDLWNSRNLYSGAYIEDRNGVARKDAYLLIKDLFSKLKNIKCGRLTSKS